MGKTNPGIKKIITIWLDSEGGSETEYYRCPRCGIVVSEYEGSIVSEVPGHPPVKPYSVIKCKGNFKRKDCGWEECGRYYIFMAAVFTKNPQTTK